MAIKAIADYKPKPSERIKSFLIEKLYKEEHDYIGVQEIAISSNEVIADIFVVNGCIHIYEIKSNKDNITRLEKQILIYKKYAHKLTIVTEENFYNKYKSEIERFHNIYDFNLDVLKDGKFESYLKQSAENILTKNAYIDYWTSKELYLSFSKHKQLGIEKLRSFLKYVRYNNLKSITLTMLKEKYKVEHINNLENINRTNRLQKRNFDTLKIIKHDFKKDFIMNKYIPRIKFTDNTAQLIEQCKKYQNTIPYLCINIADNSPPDTINSLVAKRIASYNKISDEIAHFVDYLPYDNKESMKNKNGAIKVYNLNPYTYKAHHLTALLLSQDKTIGIIIDLHNLAENINDILIYTAKVNKKIYLFINCNDKINIAHANIAQPQNSRALINLVNTLKDKTHKYEVVLIGSSIKDYSDLPLDKIESIENSFFNLYSEIRDNLFLENDVNVHYSDYLGYEENTITDEMNFTNPRTFPRAIIFDNKNVEQSAFYFIRISPLGKKTSQSVDFGRLRDYISDLIDEAHCDACETLKNRVAWTNNIKNSCFFHNLNVMATYFENAIPQE